VREEERMEQRTVALEKLISEQERLMAEMRADITGLKESMLDIKEMLRDLKKGDKMSEGGESSVNGDERKEEWSRQGNKSDVEDEGELKPWSRRVELPIFEGVDPMGWLARAEKFFEVQNVIGRERLKLAFISMEGSGCPWLSFWRKNSKNPSWEEFSMALNRRFGLGERRGVLFLRSWQRSNRMEELMNTFKILSF